MRPFNQAEWNYFAQFKGDGGLAPLIEHINKRTVFIIDSVGIHLLDGTSHFTLEATGTRADKKRVLELMLKEPDPCNIMRTCCARQQLRGS